MNTCTKYKEFKFAQNVSYQCRFTFTITSDVLYNIPQIENKFMLAEAIVAYHVLIKRTAVLDNFAKGLATLYVLKAIQENPSQFEEVFLANETLDGCAVMEMMKFSSVDENIERMLTNFLLNGKKQDNCITNIMQKIQTLAWDSMESSIAEKATCAKSIIQFDGPPQHGWGCTAILKTPILPQT